MKTTTVQIIAEDLFSGIELLKPEPGDVIIMHYKTDEFGNPLIDLDEVRNTLYDLDKMFEGKVKIIVLGDRISLESVESGEKVIESLKNVIQYVKDGMDHFKN